MKQTLKIIAVSALAAAIAIKAAPVLAEPAAEQTMSVVHTSDLDLSSREGQRTLDHRLVIAVVEVCGEAFDADLAGRNMVRQCRKDMLAEGRARGAAVAAREAGGVKIAVASNH